MVDLLPARRGDRRTVEAVFAGLSERSRRLRYLGPMPELPPRHVERLADVGRCGREALVATDRDSGEPIGIARYVREQDGAAEVAFEVVDAWQGRGIGTRLVGELACRAARDGIRRFHATVAGENRAALALLKRLGTIERRTWEGGTLVLTVRLEACATA
jgi:RimJ/RimL family protein N-acetyltransferase